MGWFCASALVHSACAEPVLLDCAAQQSASWDLPPAAPIGIKVRGAAGAWLEIEEAGVDAGVVGADAGAFEVTVPTRYGRFFLPAESRASLRVARVAPSKSRAAIRVRLHCALTPGDAIRVDWYRRAAEVSVRLMPIPRGEAPERTLADIARLDADSPDPSAHALAAHLRAQTWYAAARTSESVPAFAAAESAWLAAGDSSRALAARVGHVEELYRAGQYRRVLDAAIVPSGIAATDGYFAMRIVAGRCLAFTNLGELAKAIPCYTEVIRTTEGMAEHAEAASLLLNFADIQRQLGRSSEAGRIVLRAIDIVDGPFADIARGRAQLLLSTLALGRGDVVAALNQIDRAIARFDAVHDVRWAANALLRAASLYGQFGAIDESHAFIAAAFERLSERDAPDRVAAVQVTAARTDLREGEFDEALRSARSAQAIYQRLAMPQELDITRALIAAIHLKLDDVDAAEMAWRERASTAGPTALDWDLVGVQLAIRHGRLEDARATIAGLKRQTLTLTRQLKLAEVEALYLERSGRRADALRGLHDTAVQVRDLASAAGNPLLAELLLHQVAPLRTLAFRLILDEQDERRLARGDASTYRQALTVSAAWNWLQFSVAPRGAAKADPGTPVTNADLDALIARELLTPSRPSQDRAAAPHDLQTLLGAHARSTTERAVASRDASLAKFQQRLPPGTSFVAYVDANARGALLWVTHDTAQLVPAPDARWLRDATATLLGLVSDPATPIATIDAAAETVSARLFASAPQSDAPASLLIEAGAEFGMIPWPLLRWRAGAGELIESTTLRFMHAQTACCRATPGQPQLRVLVAGQVRSDTQGVMREPGPPPAERSLPALPTAAIEARLIEEAIGDRMPVTIDVATDRGALLGRLAQAGDWIHVAAHGDARPGRIGYSGIWLDPAEAGDTPTFLGALDVLQNTVGSDLVVLGACRLGARFADGIRPSFSFADAMSRAGARHVVAALWPISDSAAGLWVPAFYRTATSADTIATSLRSAQLQLRASRRFRHPYYWASLIDLETAPLRDAMTPMPTRVAIAPESSAHPD
jgi:tetratricopeptide (TPR) repeat protein